MVALFHIRQCLDSRDNVFAFLGLASDTEVATNIGVQDSKVGLLTLQQRMHDIYSILDAGLG